MTIDSVSKSNFGSVDTMPATPRASKIVKAIAAARAKTDMEKDVDKQMEEMPATKIKEFQELFLKNLNQPSSLADRIFRIHVCLWKRL